MCALCFDYLGAEVMRSGDIEGNASSAAVSRRVVTSRTAGVAWRTPSRTANRWERDLLLTPDIFVRPPVVHPGPGARALPSSISGAGRPPHTLSDAAARIGNCGASARSITAPVGAPPLRAGVGQPLSSVLRR